MVRRPMAPPYPRLASKFRPSFYHLSAQMMIMPQPSAEQTEKRGLQEACSRGVTESGLLPLPLSLSLLSLAAHSSFFFFFPILSPALPHVEQRSPRQASADTARSHPRETEFGEGAGQAARDGELESRRRRRSRRRGARRGGSGRVATAAH